MSHQGTIHRTDATFDKQLDSGAWYRTFPFPPVQRGREYRMVVLETCECAECEKATLDYYGEESETTDR